MKWVLLVLVWLAGCFGIAVVMNLLFESRRDLTLLASMTAGIVWGQVLGMIAGEFVD